jgi:uncharacterized protein (AIM24 family)
MPEWKIAKDNLLSFVEVELTNESVRSEAGALRYYQGPIEMKAQLPSVGGFFKSKLSGQKVIRPVYSGTGVVMLEPSFHDFFALELDDETYILDRGAYWASDVDIDVTARVNKISTSMLSGEGLIQTAVVGTGTVIVRSPGPVQRIDLNSDRIVVDGSFAVARSAGLNFTVQASTRSVFGMFFSGELIVSVIEGTGTVYLAPVPNHALMQQELFNRALGEQLRNFGTTLQQGKK